MEKNARKHPTPLNNKGNEQGKTRNGSNNRGILTIRRNQSTTIKKKEKKGAHNPWTQKNRNLKQKRKEKKTSNKEPNEYKRDIKTSQTRTYPSGMQRRNRKI